VLAAGAIELACERSQVHAVTTSGGPVTFAFMSDRSFLPGERCVVTIHAEQVSDHFPVWAEFSAYERDYAGRIASRRGAAR